MQQRFLPWSDSCFVCGDANPDGLGLRFTVEGDEVVVRTIPRATFEGYPGRLHGGILTALLDETVGWACTLAHGRFCLTAELKVRFLAPVPAGREIEVRGRAAAVNRRRVVGEGVVMGDGGVALAQAEGRFLPVESEVHDAIVSRLKMPGRSAREDDLRVVSSRVRRADDASR